jgi:hypothetical protein
LQCRQLEDGRYAFEINGLPAVSASRLKKAAGMEIDYDEVPEHVLRLAGERGTAIHNYVETWYECGEEAAWLRSGIKPAWEGYIKSFKQLMQLWWNHSVEMPRQDMHQEIWTFSEVRRTFGRLDYIGPKSASERDLVIIDWKTRRDGPDACSDSFQTAQYLSDLAEMVDNGLELAWGDSLLTFEQVINARRYTVWIRKDGKPATAVPWNNEEDFADLNAASRLYWRRWGFGRL